MNAERAGALLAALSRGSQVLAISHSAAFQSAAKHCLRVTRGESGTAVRLKRV